MTYRVFAVNILASDSGLAMSDISPTSHPTPILTVDVVLLTLLDRRLQVGLVRRDNSQEPFFQAWALPGGFVRPQVDHDAQHTAMRVLREKAGVQSPYLEQLATFTGAARDPRGWSASIVYYALVAPHIAPEGNDKFRWEPVSEVAKRTLPFDHSAILRTAVERVQSKTSYSALPIHLMPPEFTISELRGVYEQLLGGTLEPRGFIRRVQEMNALEETGRTKTEGHRPARLYRAKRDDVLATLEPSLLPK